MLPRYSHEEIDKVVRTVYEELGSPVSSNDEERKKLIFDIRGKTGFGLMSIKMSLLRQNLIEIDHPIDISQYPGHPYFEMYYPDGVLIYKGDNIIMMHWIRTQIKRYSIYGCYIKYNDEIITIDHMGNLSHYPEGFDDLITDIFMKLV